MITPTIENPAPRFIYVQSMDSHVKRIWKSSASSSVCPTNFCCKGCRPILISQRQP